MEGVLHIAISDTSSVLIYTFAAFELFTLIKFQAKLIFPSLIKIQIEKVHVHMLGRELNPPFQLLSLTKLVVGKI